MCDWLQVDVHHLINMAVTINTTQMEKEQRQNNITQNAGQEKQNCICSPQKRWHFREKESDRCLDKNLKREQIKYEQHRNAAINESHRKFCSLCLETFNQTKGILTWNISLPEQQQTYNLYKLFALCFITVLFFGDEYSGDVNIQLHNVLHLFFFIRRGFDLLHSEAFHLTTQIVWKYYLLHIAATEKYFTDPTQNIKLDMISTSLSICYTFLLSDCFVCREDTTKVKSNVNSQQLMRSTADYQQDM